MRSTWLIVAFALAAALGCNRGGGEPAAPAPETPAQPSQPAPSPSTSSPRAPSATAGSELPAGDNPSPTDQTGSAPAPSGAQDGYFESERFNVRFQLPSEWHLVSSPSDDSLEFQGPDGIQMVVANSRSIQLVDANFQSLNDRVSFDNVNILPDRSEARPVNGMPGYRVEGDALLRGQDIPVYFISQAVNVPGEPVMATIFIPGDNYYEHSDGMKAVLDSIEALNLRPE